MILTVFGEFHLQHLQIPESRENVWWELGKFIVCKRPRIEKMLYLLRKAFIKLMKTI